MAAPEAPIDASRLATLSYASLLELASLGCMESNAVSSHAKLLIDREMEQAHTANPMPIGSRAIIHGIRSQPHYNGEEVTVIAWLPAKSRYAVGFVSLNEAAVQVRCSQLDRCSNPFAKLEDENLLREILSTLSSWDTAACAMAVQRSWRQALRNGCWPIAAPVLAPEPVLWAAPGGEQPSWTLALSSLPGAERIAAVLDFVDSMARLWPGVLPIRWPGVHQRLSWLCGRTVDEPLTNADVKGHVFSRSFSGERVRTSCRYHGMTYPTDGLPAPPCAYTLPADAALFFALVPEGFGSKNDRDADDSGSLPLTGTYQGLDVQTASLHMPKLRLRKGAGFSRTALDADDAAVGCAFADRLPVAMTRDVIDGHLICLYLCCDLQNAHFGKILLLETPPPGDARRSRRVTWTTASLSRLLQLIAAAAQGPARQPDWDVAWSAERGALGRLIAALKSGGQEVEMPLQPKFPPPVEQQAPRTRESILDEMLASFMLEGLSREEAVVQMGRPEVENLVDHLFATANPSLQA